MWELPIHWDRDGRLILYNLAMIVFSSFILFAKRIYVCCECYLSCSNWQNFLLFSSIYFPIVLSSKNWRIMWVRPQRPHYVSVYYFPVCQRWSWLTRNTCNIKMHQSCGLNGEVISTIKISSKTVITCGNQEHRVWPITNQRPLLFTAHWHVIYY